MRAAIGYQPPYAGVPPRLVVGVSGGEVGGGLGLLIAGAAVALVAIPLYKRAMAAIYEHRALQLESSLALNRSAYAELTHARSHARSQVTRYRKKGLI
jgi:hypothetical protein